MASKNPLLEQKNIRFEAVGIEPSTGAEEHHEVFTGHSMGFVWWQQPTVSVAVVTPANLQHSWVSVVTAANFCYFCLLEPKEQDLGFYRSIEVTGLFF